MAKRQVKITFDRITEYLETENKLSFILKNGSVTLGTPISLQSNILKIKNTKENKMDLPLSEIEEIWAEEEPIH